MHQQTKRLAVLAFATALLTVGTLLLSAAPAAAPEPARLNASLSGKNSSASATYTYSNVSTRAYQWPGTWAVGSIQPGTPCATYAAATGTTLYSTIQASGSYRKCL